LRDSLKEYRQLLISFLFVLPLRVSKRWNVFCVYKPNGFFEVKEW
jgi:hypothetical protein